MKLIPVKLDRRIVSRSTTAKGDRDKGWSWYERGRGFGGGSRKLLLARGRRGERVFRRVFQEEWQGRIIRINLKPWEETDRQTYTHKETKRERGRKREIKRDKRDGDNCRKSKD